MDNTYVVTGSANLTARGMLHNTESMLVFKAGPVFDCSEIRWNAAFAAAVHALQPSSEQPKFTKTQHPRAAVTQLAAQCRACSAQQTQKQQTQNEQHLQLLLVQNHQTFMAIMSVRFDEQQLIRFGQQQQQHERQMQHEERLLQQEQQHQERMRLQELQHNEAMTSREQTTLLLAALVKRTP